MSKPKVLLAHHPIPEEITEKLKQKFEVQIIKKNCSSVTKQDLIENIPGKFGLLLIYAKPNIIDKEFMDAAADDAHEVAELAVGLLIATAKNFMEANQQIKTGKVPMMRGMGLTNSVVGIVGCGNIGIVVADILSGFKLSELLYTSRKPKSQVECLGGKIVSIDDLIRRSDFIILTSALTPETKFTINKDRLAAMKPNAVIINVGRGLLIDQDALINALRDNRIRGAGLDVMTPEPIPLDNPLLTMENVVLLPHIAGNKIDGAFQRKLNVAADNILAVLNNQPMPCEVKL